MIYTLERERKKVLPAITNVLYLGFFDTLCPPHKLSYIASDVAGEKLNTKK